MGRIHIREKLRTIRPEVVHIRIQSHRTRKCTHVAMIRSRQAARGWNLATIGWVHEPVILLTRALIVKNWKTRVSSLALASA